MDDEDEFDENASSNIIVKNNNILMTRIYKNHYKIEYSIENNNTYLPILLDFNIIKLIYDINKEFFENVNLEIISQEEAKIFILIKHLFQDFGIPQRFVYLNIYRKLIDNKYIIFDCIINENINDIQSIIPENTVMLPINKIKIICHIETPHKIQITQELMYNPEFNIPKFMEKMAGIIFTKMFLRTKQFIENLNK